LFFRSSRVIAHLGVTIVTARPIARHYGSIEICRPVIAADLSGHLAKNDRRCYGELRTVRGSALKYLDRQTKVYEDDFAPIVPFNSACWFDIVTRRLQPKGRAGTQQRRASSNGVTDRK
jgi:hypothetical protein